MEPANPIYQQMATTLDAELKKDYPELTLKVETLVIERGYIHSSRLSNWPQRNDNVTGFIGVYRLSQDQIVYVLFSSNEGTHIRVEKYVQTTLFPPPHLSIEYCEITPPHPIYQKMVLRVEKRFKKQWPFITFKAESIYISIKREKFHTSRLSKTYKGPEDIIRGFVGVFTFNNRHEKLHSDDSGNHLAMQKIWKINKYPEEILSAISEQQPINDQTEVTSAKFNGGDGYWEVWVRCGTKEYYGLSDKTVKKISTGKDQLPMYLLV